MFALSEKIVKDKKELEKKSEDVHFDEVDVKNIVSELKIALKASGNGIGISAPQIGTFYRICLISNEDGLIEMINPIIEKREEAFVNRNEGCLSFPGVWLDTIRYKKIEVSYQDIAGNTKVKNFGNFASIVAQHEIDHLNGITFFSRKVPEKYDPCFCDSGKKFKFCHMKNA